MRDEIGDRNALQTMFCRESLDLRPGHDGAVIIGELADHAHGRQTREPAKIDRRLGMARTHEHPAFPRDQRKHMAGADKIGRPHIAIGETANRIAALFGGNPGGQAMLDIDRYREGGAVRRVVGRHHRLKVQSSGVGGGHRRADDAAAIADDEGHFFRRAQRGGANEIAFVLAVAVVGDDDDFAARDRLDRLRDRMGHRGNLPKFERLVGITYGRAARAAIQSNARTALRCKRLDLRFQAVAREIAPAIHLLAASLASGSILQGREPASGAARPGARRVLDGMTPPRR